MGVILGILAKIILGITGRWVGAEIGAQHKPLCVWLVKFAAARLPEEEQAAAESEWLAVVEDLRSPTAQLLHSMSFAISSLRIRHAIHPEMRVRPGAFMGAVLGNVTGLIAAVYCMAVGIVPTSARESRLFEWLWHTSVPNKIALLAALLTFILLASYWTCRLTMRLLPNRLADGANKDPRRRP